MGYASKQHGHQQEMAEGTIHPDRSCVLPNVMLGENVHQQQTVSAPQLITLMGEMQHAMVSKEICLLPEQKVPVTPLAET